MNFALILFVLTCVTFLFWVAERWKFLPERRRKAEEAARRFEADNREAIDRGDATVIDERNRLSERILRQPWWLEYTAGLFPVIAVVFLLRSFLFEPFRIPSGSMLPTLHIGDFILVNKFDYGIRLPVTNTKIIPVGSPERGDVVVFKYPMDTQVDYIKRVVGLPGDTVEYRDKVLYVNGVEQKQTGSRDFVDDSTMITLEERDEQLGEVNHLIARDGRRPSWVPPQGILRKEKSCDYNARGFVCTVPEGHYFMMGDNRDNSEDSRYWGFVPDEDLVGRAVLIWANFGDMSRVGGFR
ncbi:signal peptidase I [Sutterella megalosphaeroides]|uniref:Signal peptidase I n=1 Tax=Sutterella megalosphaeroides TaxID=2494234 RepID=A0A2Z6IGY8_9BURK|nr:signal peptidase I [Sutterella megalosphaeroides]BBF23996.1 signal peptidase I [Sutterella megalosphaeroides]